MIVPLYGSVTASLFRTRSLENRVRENLRGGRTRFSVAELRGPCLISVAVRQKARKTVLIQVAACGQSAA